MRKYFVVTGWLLIAVAMQLKGAFNGAGMVITQQPGGFPLSVAGKSVPLYVSNSDFAGVIRAATDLQTDIGKVTGAIPQLHTEKVPKSKLLVIAGTLGKSPVIDKLVGKGLIQVDQLTGKWESFQIQLVQKPMPGVKEALVIVGSDKRGTIYGLYEISSGIGVSPWYWWADVPVEHRDALYVSINGAFKLGPPSVKYRGIFLNDEYPNLTRWVSAKFGTAKVSENPPVPEGIANYGREFYTRLFELILRLRGNYLWPAMWNNAFNEDDPENPRLADEYGVVMGNSHQEPMLRAQKEWDRRYMKTLGRWNYSKHPEVLHDFWREGIRRNRSYESIVTIGLRGADDTEMGPGGPEANMRKLEEIVGVQRKILTEEINPDITKIPQLWCLYKEVQEYYNKGLRVPDDVTLLWAEDNWGNIRRVPSVEERKRNGGAGIYYHFDYHGGPRSYQWTNTSPIAKIWDQLSYAKQYGADRIWIVNVGHFKAYSFPMHYFMDLAWFGNDSLKHDNIREYTKAWAIQQFGNDYADETAEILTQYTRFNGRRKPELLSPTTYSLTDYFEAEKVVFDYNKIAEKAEGIFNKLPEPKRDAYYQLVAFPALSNSIVNQLYVAAGRNNLHALQKRASTNDWATITQNLFTADTSLMNYFNNQFAGGKWKHFQDQSHLGYTAWNDPPMNSLRHIKLQQIEVPTVPEMGVALEGTQVVWPDDTGAALLPEFDVFNRQSRYIEVFNKGKGFFKFDIESATPWIRFSNNSGMVEKDMRVWVQIDWNQVPEGKNSSSFTVSALGRQVVVNVSVFKPAEITPASLKGFVEANGYVSMEAAHYAKNKQAGGNAWIEIEDFGHTLSGMRATAVTDAPPLTPGKDAPCLEYQMYLFSTGKVEVNPYVAPTLNFLPGRPVRYAIAFDNEEPQVVTLVPGDFDAMNGNREWEQSVRNNYRIGKSAHDISSTGYHTLKIWMIDPGVVLQKIVVNTGGVKPSYLGPPESFHNK